MKVSKILYGILGLFLMSINSFAENKTVKLATLDWPPYVGKALPNMGAVTEIVKAAYAEKGYKIDVVLLPWVRAIQYATEGKDENGNVYAGYMPEYMSEGVAKTFNMSDPFFDGPVGFMVCTKPTCKGKEIKLKYKLETDLNNTYKQLNTYNFGVVQDYVNEEKFDANKDLKKQVVRDDITNIKRLWASHDIDIVFIDKYVANYLIAEQMPTEKDSFEYLTPDLQIKQLYIAFSKKGDPKSEYLNAFNEGLKSLIKNGKYDKIKKAAGFFK